MCAWSPATSRIRKPPPPGVLKTSLDDAFSTCEIIVLAGGSTAETYHMIGARQFEQMRENALFVNIARGKMVRRGGP